jgi:hypothetical protein
MGYRVWPDYKHETNKELEFCMLVTIARRLKDNCPFIGTRLGKAAPAAEAAQ